MTDLRELVMAWSRAGALPPERVDDALRVAGVTPTSAHWRAFVLHLLVWLGAVLLAAAACHFVAANWQVLGRYGKFALVELALVAAVALACWRGLDSLAGRAALFAGALLTGVLLALVGQVYQTGADAFELFALWALFVLPWAVVGRQPALCLLVVALVDVAILLYFRTSVARGLVELELLFVPMAAIWSVIAFNVLVLVAWEAAAAAWGGWIAVRWAPRLLAASAGIALTMLAVRYGVGWGHDGPGIASLLAYAAFSGAMFWAYRMRARDLVMLSGLASSGIVLATAILGRWALPYGGILAFLVLGVFVVGCGYAAAKWLRRLAEGEATHDA